MNKKAVIVGGGIAGLTAAIAFEQIGIEAEVFEASPKLEPIGAGIWMAPNAMQVFDRLGIADEVKAAGKVLWSVRVCDKRFRVIQTSDLTAAEKEFGFSIVAIHRGTLQKILLSRLKSEKIHCGYVFDSFNTDGQKVNVQFQNGQVTTGNLLIGADGVHSKVRGQLFGNKPLRYSGLTCWRGITKFALNDAFKATSFELWGGRNRFGFSEITEDTVYWYAASKAQSGKTLSGELARKYLTDQFKDFASPVVDLIESTDPQKMIHTDLCDLPPTRPWAKENICLIGDAAHPMTPNLGQGGAQAIEDAFLLSKELSGETSTAKALHRFEARRFKKIQKIVNDAYFFGKLAHMETGSKFRNLVLRLIPQGAAQRSMHTLFRID